MYSSSHVSGCGDSMERERERERERGGGRSVLLHEMAYFSDHQMKLFQSTSMVYLLVTL